MRGCRHFEEYKPVTSLIILSMVGALDHLCPGNAADPIWVDQFCDIMAYNRLTNIQNYGPSEADVKWLEDEARISKQLVETKFSKEIQRVRKLHNLEDPSAPKPLIELASSYNKREDSTDDDSIERQALDTSTV